MMGESGGRSKGHPKGQGAVRRSTPRQRSYVDPPPGEERTDEAELPLPGLSPNRVVIFAAVTVGVLAVVVGAVVVGVWTAAVLGLTP